MTKVDIFSGFLGAGKTTLIKKLIKEAYEGEQIVLIENEFGEIGVDGGFLKDAGIQINEMNSGCICCSLVGDFGDALKKVLDEYHPDRILIEPSGVGKLSDIITAVENLDLADVVLNGFTTVVDATKAKVYMKNFGEFYNNQVEHASSIILSHTDGMAEEKLAAVVALLRTKNDHAVIVTTEWKILDGKKILSAMENKDTIKEALEHLKEEHEHEEHHHHEHHHHDHDEECECGHHHHHDDDEECECGHHHHHDHDEECECGHHHHDHEHHHHDHDHECGCGHHHHDHEGHHHADEVFDSLGYETTKSYDPAELKAKLDELQDFATYGQVLRAKGIVASTDGRWIHFDYVPGESDVRFGAAEVTGRICVIGAGLEEDAVKELFGIL
ncbi:MAG: GTP-binding protein [Clostridia bacterium]|nr:GTP-binding protein [Clostridia bacterium]